MKKKYSIKGNNILGRYKNKIMISIPNPIYIT